MAVGTVEARATRVTSPPGRRTSAAPRGSTWSPEGGGSPVVGKSEWCSHTRPGGRRARGAEQRLVLEHQHRVIAADGRGHQPDHVGRGRGGGDLEAGDGEG